MQQIAAFIVVTGAVALVACASQAPASSTRAVAAAPASIPAVAAPALQAGSAQAGSGQAADKPQDAKFVVPAGYERVVRNGEERFCKTDEYTGSRVQKTKVCLTRAQLEARQDSARDWINKVQESGVTSLKSCTPGLGQGGASCP